MPSDATQLEDAARAHREVFGEERPADTRVEVGRFVSPDYLFEIEADAVVDDRSAVEAATPAQAHRRDFGGAVIRRRRATNRRQARRSRRR